MLDVETPDGLVSLCKCLPFNVKCLGLNPVLGDYFFIRV